MKANTVQNDLKKSMTKKQYKKKMLEQRSQVGLGMNLGTREMVSKKVYSRKKLNLYFD